MRPAGGRCSRCCPAHRRQQQPPGGGVTPGAPDDGGTISNGATLTVTNCTSSGNTTAPISIFGNDAGGTIGNFGTLTVAGSTFSGNSGREGGAIYSQSGSPLTVINSTFVGNTVTGGDGGAISSSHTILTRSLLAGISSPSCSGVTPTDSGGNRVDDTSCPVTASARLAAALKLGP